MMGGNNYYSNAEAYAFDILHQKMVKEAQRSAQQTVLELSALRSFLGQGQFLYCIPIGGFPHHPITSPWPLCSPPALPLDTPFPPPDPHHHSLPPPPPPPPHPPCSPTSHPSQQQQQQQQQPQPQPQSVLHVNVKNGQQKILGKSGSDECNLGKDGIEVTIDLREYLPAEINMDVDEKIVEIKARHVDVQGSKTFTRRYDLPACITLDSVKCILSHDGILLFSAAWLKME